MNIKIKKELKKFREFKKTFKFTQKEIIEDEDKFYCDGEIVKEGDTKFSESDKWINVGYNFTGLSKILSNLFSYSFYFKGKKLNSIEAFFQGIKFKDKKLQNYILKYSGKDALNIKAASDYNWQETKIVYWQGKPIKRNSIEYDNLVDELYISAIQNPLYRNSLKICNKDIIHSIGKSSKEETTFTRFEFEYMLNCLRSFLKEN